MTWDCIREVFNPSLGNILEVALLWQARFDIKQQLPLSIVICSLVHAGKLDNKEDTKKSWDWKGWFFCIFLFYQMPLGSWGSLLGSEFSQCLHWQIMHLTKIWYIYIYVFFLIRGQYLHFWLEKLMFQNIQNNCLCMI